MQGLRARVAVCALGVVFACGLLAAEQPTVPALSSPVAVSQNPLEIQAGTEWSRVVVAPDFGQAEAPVLSLKAYAEAGGGCNNVLQVLIDGLPLTESAFRRRLLNKLPVFAPPGTEYHFSWFDSRQNRWMTMFGSSPEITWGGTGRDTEFLFDLTGLVVPGRSAEIGFRHAMPELPTAIKRERAPLVVIAPTLGTIPRESVDELRRQVEGAGGLRKLEVRTGLSPEIQPGARYYEVERSQRGESPRAQVSFEDLSQWQAWVKGDMDVSVEASCKHRLWREQGVRIAYSGPGSGQTTVLLRPCEPIPVADTGADAADLWLFGETDRLGERHPQAVAYLVDARGRDLSIELGAVKNSFWVLLHGVLGERVGASVVPPLKVTGISLTLFPVKAERSLHLESMAVYRQGRHPFTEHTRPDPPTFPVNDAGMLPTPPAGAVATVTGLGNGTLFCSRSAAGTLEFRVVPDDGVLNGITARWNGGTWFTPMSGGQLQYTRADGLPPGKGRITQAELNGDRFEARWEANGISWGASYALRGRTLVVDVECAGGAATGLRYGAVEGLPETEPLFVPYLCYGNGYGPQVACGKDVFVSVLADWYHSDCSLVNANVRNAGDEQRLMAGTEYLPLTDGTRNNLRERVLVTVSPEFADILPNIPNPASPNMARLSPYMFFMSSYMRPSLWRTMKRHGIDHVIACDFARFYVQDFVEGFAGRWRPHPSLDLSQIQDYRRGIHGLGYLFGAYSDLRDWFPLNGFWDTNCVSLDSVGDLVDGWYGNFHTKPNYLPVLARLVGERVHEHYPPDCVYMDTHTCMGLLACDFEAGVPGAGIARDQVLANGDCILETRKWYGSTMSEGRVRWAYAGIADMDYASLFLPEAAADLAPLPDFDLLKIHPLNLGTMMGYAPSTFFRRTGPELAALNRDQGTALAPQGFHQYVCASLLHGHMLMLGYSYLPPLARMVQLYASMQGLQTRYLTDTVAEIAYHDGERFLSTGDAIRSGARALGRVRVTYSGGLVLYANYNGTSGWSVEGRQLPPYGWLATKGTELLAFSAAVAGNRVDYVRCPEYTYLNTGETEATVEGIGIRGAVWLKREASGLRVVPCGNLGRWESFAPPGLPEFMQDLRPTGMPEDRGCGTIRMDTVAFMGRQPQTVEVVARDSAEAPCPAVTRVVDGYLEIQPTAQAVDYTCR